MTILDALRTHIALAAARGETETVATSDGSMDVEFPFEDSHKDMLDVGELIDPASNAVKKHKNATEKPTYKASDVLVLNKARYKTMKTKYMRDRVRKANGKTVAQIRKLKVENSKGETVLYKDSDISYDLSQTYLEVKCKSAGKAMLKAATILQAEANDFYPLHASFLHVIGA